MRGRGSRVTIRINPAPSLAYGPHRAAHAVLVAGSRRLVRVLGAFVDISDVLGIVGLLCLVAFAYLLFPPAALAVAGAALLTVSVLRSRRGR